MIKVVKFGGSSLSNAQQFKKIKNIVTKDSSRKIIVASACGKASSDDHKVTDLLYLCQAHVKYGMDYEMILSLIEEKHQEIIENLQLDFDLKKEMDAIREILSKKGSLDQLVSRGEYLSSRLLALYLDAECIDAKDVIMFDYDGKINLEATQTQLLPRLKTSKRVVVPGFYGSLPNGMIKLMSRGGSDITGSILANVVQADVYENFTDVSGMLVCDPRIIDHPKRIDYITYAELREMSYMGANVLHDEAIFPVKLKNIPINVRNTNDPDNPGTMIVDQCPAEVATPLITGITGKKGFTVISVSKGHSASEVGFLKKALQIFENYGISVVTLATGVDSFSIVVVDQDVNDCLYGIVNDLKTELQCEEVKIFDELALVCVVGRGMKAKTGMSGQIFGELGNQKINIKTISQGADEISIIIGVNEDDFTKTIESIYQRFIGE